MRTVTISGRLSRLIAATRKARGIKTPARVRLEDVLRVEAELACRIPDAVLAVLVAGLCGHRLRRPAAHVGFLVETTMDMRESVIEATEQLDEPAVWNADGYVAFEQIDANYYAFAVGEAADSETVALIDHETLSTEPPESMPIGDFLDAKYLDNESAEGTAIEMYSEPEAPTPTSETRVTHPKFGAGSVIEREGSGDTEKWTVAFDSGQVKKLLARFVTAVAS